MILTDANNMKGNIVFTIMLIWCTLRCIVTLVAIAHGVYIVNDGSLIVPRTPTNRFIFFCEKSYRHSSHTISRSYSPSLFLINIGYWATDNAAHC